MRYIVDHWPEGEMFNDQKRLLSIVMKVSSISCRFESCEPFCQMYQIEIGRDFPWFIPDIYYQISFLSHSKIFSAQPTLAPIWLPHWPACRWTISLIFRALQLGRGLRGDQGDRGGDQGVGREQWPAAPPPVDCPVPSWEGAARPPLPSLLPPSSIAKLG